MKTGTLLRLYQVIALDGKNMTGAAELAEKALQGVKVYVLYDSFGSFGIEQLWKPKPTLSRSSIPAG